jgi:putative transposase
MGDTTRLLTEEVGMPWRETAPMAERMRFVTDWERDLYSMVELCDRYGVSRKTGYKWLTRYEADGPDGLRERSRAPHQCPHRIAPEVARLICAARRQHPSWGPAKLVAWLRPRYPAVDWPAVSTAGDLLARRGLVKKRRRRRHYQHPGDDHEAQRSLDGRLQGPLPHARRHLLLSADDR